MKASERKQLIDAGLFHPDDLVGMVARNNERVNDNRLSCDISDDTGLHKRHKTDNEVVDNVIASEEEAKAINPATKQLNVIIHLLFARMDESTDSEMRLWVNIVRIVLGIGAPPTMTELAKQHNLARATVSLRCRKLLRLLNLPPSHFMRNETFVKSYRKSALLHHLTKKDGVKPPLGNLLKAGSKIATQSRQIGRAHV